MIFLRAWRARGGSCDHALSSYTAIVRKLVASSLLALSLVACSQEERAPTRGASAPTPASETTAALPAGLSRVADLSQVCMVNDQFMGRPQIPVEVDGRTYFGCCAMCQQRIQSEPAVRAAQDPVTGEPVDKARAIIVQDAAGKLFYFASEATLRDYRG